MGSNEIDAAQYISKPMPVEAMQWAGANREEFHEWFEQLDASAVILTIGIGDSPLRLKTELLDVDVCVSDLIICNRNGVVFLAHNKTSREGYTFSEDVLDPKGGSAQNPFGD